MKNIIHSLLIKMYLLGKNLYQKKTYQSYRQMYGLKDSFRFNGEGIKIYGDGKLLVGHNSYVGSYSTIQLEKDCVVSVGMNCRISHNVRMYTSSAVPNQDFNNFNALKKIKGNITLGDAVWIGANVFIGPGITIGNNSIVGANSVVTRDVPENSIVGGVPAKLIRLKSINDKEAF